MFRHSLSPCACFGVVLGLAVIVPAGPAWSQDRSAPERLDRLERDLNMLQRQVYRGAPPPMMGADPGVAVNAEIRMDRLETQMRDLTGRVEEFINQMERLRQRVEQIDSDIEARFSQSPTAPVGPYAAAMPPPRSRPGMAPGRQPAEPVSAPPSGLAPRASPGSPYPPGTAAPPPSGPAPGFGTLTPPGTPPGSPPELASAASAAPPPAGGLLPGGSAGEQYNYAFGLLKQADYPAAEAALQAFVEQHPKDPMAGNAQYWLGETYYTRGRYMEAAKTFAEGYKRYPKGPKAADDLLKLGMSLARADQKQNACVALARLDTDFPHAAANLKQQAASEQKRLGC